MDILTKEDMQKLICCIPECAHEHHADEVVLMPRCHPFTGIRGEIKNNVLVTACNTCLRICGRMALLDQRPQILRPPCHPQESIFQLRCRRSTGETLCICIICKTVFAAFPLRSKETTP